MSLAGSRVGIVGGSIGGCAAAIALRHMGCDVTIFERSTGLDDRGQGVMIPGGVWTDLVDMGYLDADMRTQPCARRLWMVADDSEPAGRVGWQHPLPAQQANWGLLWRGLRARVPDADYRGGQRIARIEPDSDGVAIHTADGAVRRFDAVVGADGYRSTVRALVAPDAAVSYAGYLLWRGTFPAERLPRAAPAELADAIIFVGLPVGHLVGYLIPGLAPGSVLMNWVCYAPAPAGMTFDEPTSLPPGSVPDVLLEEPNRVAAAYAPPVWREIVRTARPDELSVQPIYDVVVPHYVAGRLLLTGDAGTVARPHTGAGATKSLQDALALERICAEHDGWDAALAAYDAERCATGNEMVALGRRLGQSMVLTPPPWHAMAEQEIASWQLAVIQGLSTPYDISRLD